MARLATKMRSALRIWAALCFAPMIAVCPASGALGSDDLPLVVEEYFPDLEGWREDESPAVYDPETLYEYINGAADIYLSYDFRELASLYYERGENQGIAVDVYRHSTRRNAFGIYSQERPREADFIDVGAQGYYDKGVLNFYLGVYYVKIAGFSLGDEDESILKSLAKRVAKRLDEKPGLPETLAALPDSGRVANSEKYIATSFMGHGFLKSAYVAAYKVDDREFEVFIIEAEDETEAENMVKSYVKLAMEKGQAVESEGSFYRFTDPYQSSKGKVNLAIEGAYVWGMLSDDASVYEYYLEEIGKGLKEMELL